MNNPVIRAKNLSKQYKIGLSKRYNTLLESLSDGLSVFFRQRLFNGSRPNGTNEEYIWALKDITFEVRRGEVVGIIGSNGSGKSTLLKILSRITEPSEGYAEINGRVGSLLEVGSGFHGELSGRENIYLNGTILGMKRLEINRKFDEIVEFSGVRKFIDTPVKHYSSGMRVRLAFAVAAHLEPEILLVDEVLAVGDAAFRQKCLGKMEEVAKEGRTVLFVSHDMAAIASLCQRGILLTEGRIEMDGLSEATIAHYLSTVRKRQTPVEGKVLLLNHPGRRKQGEGLVRLSYCKLLNKDRQAAKFFRSGDEARVTIGYQISDRLGNSPLIFCLHFSDLLGRRVFSCSNEFVGYDCKADHREGEVQCVIPKLPLIPGRYVISFGCRVGPVWSDGVYDAVELEVVAGDFYGTGRLPPEGWGSSLVEHRWVTNSE